MNTLKKALEYYWKIPQIATLKAIEASMFRDNFNILINESLDFGSGKGIFAKIAGLKFDVALDKNNADLDYSKKINMHKKYVCDDNSFLRSNPNSYNLIIANSVLEHTDDLDETVNDIITSLKIGGRFFVTVPNKSSFHNTKYLSENEKRVYNDNLINIFDHKNLLTSNEWLNVFESGGLAIEKHKSYCSKKLSDMIYLLDNFQINFWKEQKDSSINNGLIKELIDYEYSVFKPVYDNEINSMPLINGSCDFFLCRKI